MALKIAPDFLVGVWGNGCKGKLGMIHAPGLFSPKKPDIIRDINEDLRILKDQYKIETLVSLIQDHERPKYKLTEKKSICERMGIKYMNYPIPDYSVPQNPQTFKIFVKKVVDEEIRKDKVVIAHCRAGLGRTGIFASACLIYAGLEPNQAIQLVRKTRNGMLETYSQVKFIKKLQF